MLSGREKAMKPLPGSWSDVCMTARITIVFCSCQSDTVAVKTQNDPCVVRVFVSATQVRPIAQATSPWGLGRWDLHIGGELTADFARTTPAIFTCRRLSEVIDW